MSLETGLILYASDLDATSQYPSAVLAANISKGTLRQAFFSIENKHPDEVRRYFINLVTVSENAVLLSEEFFNLPSYKEMTKLVGQRLSKTVSD